jgi:hypothetical protein
MTTSTPTDSSSTPDYSHAIQALKVAAWCFAASTLGLGVGLATLDDEGLKGLTYGAFGLMVVAGMAAHILAVVGWFRMPKRTSGTS